MYHDIESTKKHHDKIKNDFVEFDQILGKIVEFSEIRVRLYNVFRSIHKEMNQGVPIEEILNFIFNSLSHVFSFDRIGIALVENADSVIKAKWMKSKKKEDWVKKNYAEPLSTSVLLEVIETNKPIVIFDFEEYLLTNPVSKGLKLIIKEGMKSGVAFPLRIDGKPIGTITFCSVKPHNFENYHVDLLGEISEGLAGIVEKELLKNSVSQFKFKENSLKSSIHDLNNSLTVIHGTLDKIERLNKYHDLKEDSQRSLLVMRRNCEAMINIARSIVYGETSDRKIIDLREFISEIRLEALILGKDKNILVEVTIGSHVTPYAQIDTPKVKQALMNLISNAIKFSKRDKKVNIRMDFDAEGKRLFFTVEDQGPGIPEMEQSHLFQQFGKTSVKPTEGEPSSGLGLANVKRLVEIQNGQVFVNSQVGKGSIFGFWVPIERQKP